MPKIHSTAQSATHTPLNDNLERIGAEESAACACGACIEPIQHFLFYCPKWRSERSNLQAALADRWRDLAYVLEGWSGRRDRGTGRFVDGAKEKWKPNMGVIRAVIQYVRATGRFQLRATVVEDTGEGDGEVGGSL
jgi:hypothetical protein